MMDKFSCDLLIKSVSHVEHVLPVALSPFRVFVRKIELHAFKRKELVIQLLDTKLFIFCDVHKFDFSYLKEPLLSTEDFLGKVFGEHFV